MLARIAGTGLDIALSIFPNASVIMIEPQHEMQPYLSKLSSSVAGCHYVKAGAAREAGEGSSDNLARPIRFVLCS